MASVAPTTMVLWPRGRWRILLSGGRVRIARRIGASTVARLYAAGGDAVVVDGKVETVLDGRGARCLAVDPKDPDTLYVGTSDEGLFESTDGGGSWDRL